MKELKKKIEEKTLSVDWEILSDLVLIDEDGKGLFSGEFVRVNNLFVRQEFHSQALGSSRRAY